MLNPFCLFIIRKIFPLFPETKAFAIKRRMLRIAGARIGRNVRVSSTVKILGNSYLEIGDNTWIGHETMIVCTDRITIGKNVNIAPRCYIGTGSHVVDTEGDSIAGAGVNSPIMIEDGSWLCVGSIVLPGTIIHAKSIVAAGSIVKGEVKARSLVGGCLAQIIREL